MSPDDKKATKEEVAERGMLDDIEDATEAIKTRQRRTRVYIGGWLFFVGLSALTMFLAIAFQSEGWTVVTTLLTAPTVLALVFGLFALGEGELTADPQRKALKNAERRYRDYLTTGEVPEKKSTVRYGYDY